MFSWLAGHGSSSSSASQCPHWQQEEIRIDCPESQLKLRVGESSAGAFSDVHDVKGSAGEPGSLQITTLRFIWRSSLNKRGNLSIGLNTVQSLMCSKSESVVHGHTESLQVEAKFAGTRFQFVFRTPCTISRCAPELSVASVADRIHQSFNKSKIYRELKVKTAIITDGELDLLEYESIHGQLPRVLNVSNDQGKVGRMIFTNIRVVWYCTVDNNANLSIPYLQIAISSVRNSKYGQAMCIETYASSQASSYKFGFQIATSSESDTKRLKDVVALLRAAVQSYLEMPIFGVQFEGCLANDEYAVSDSKIDGRESLATLAGEHEDDEGLIVDEADHHKLDAYKQRGEVSGETEFIFDASLGLAVIKEKGATYTAESVWNEM
ncbi:Bardet-Biedl syndrome 5 protein [Chytriomyces hyalinus]|nr:Bardet-Biedl syndrome 5 protein [Chytriomyces hyalinus]